uniref:Uncharacterized protein n=1 Tax=Zea mays TaxID=4577 RepID=B6SMW9_MAIZE|nr:hypothetical protein [Zea mays]
MPPFPVRASPREAPVDRVICSSREADCVVEEPNSFEDDAQDTFEQGCLWCNLCSGKEEGVEADLQEFQDFDKFED